MTDTGIWMRFSVIITIACFLVLSVMLRAATFAQRNLPVLVTPTAQSVVVSHLGGTPDAGATTPDAPLRKNSLLRNIDFPDLTVTLVVHPMIERIVDSPVKVLFSTSLSQPVRPPSC